MFHNPKVKEIVNKYKFNKQRLFFYSLGISKQHI